MKVLFFDHLFRQDLRALVSRVPPDVEVAKIDLSVLGTPANEIFPPEVGNGTIGHGYYAERYASHREQWRAMSKRIYLDLRRQFPFDVFVSPSDCFYYIREFISHCQADNVPVIILQKETTMSPYFLEIHALDLGETYPFMSDFMLVNSETQKQFWVRAGADAEKIKVIGQPRFDLYQDPSRTLTLDQLGIRVDRTKPVNLAFSYHPLFYFPKEKLPPELGHGWTQIREETELALSVLAREGHTILFKPHPQQYWTDDLRNDHVAWLKSICGHAWEKNFIFLDNHKFDAVDLIMDVDTVIGYQSTTLIEAILARKNVLFTFWTDVVEQCKDDLTPFHRYGDIFGIARSPSELIELAKNRRGAEWNDQTRARREEFVTEHLGWTDGRATERAWEEIQRFTRARREPQSKRATSEIHAP